MSGHTGLGAAITRLTLLSVLIAACAQPAVAPTASPTAPAAVATGTPSASPTPAVSAFMTPEGYWTLGSQNAKVLFVDSSDFG